jgi:hypothetical protein
MTKMESRLKRVRLPIILLDSLMIRFVLIGVDKVLEVWQKSHPKRQPVEPDGKAAAAEAEKRAAAATTSEAAPKAEKKTKEATLMESDILVLTLLLPHSNNYRQAIWLITRRGLESKVDLN